MDNPIKIGDRIKFKAATRWSHEAVWRKVNGLFPATGAVTVRYGGWADFIVRPWEIIEIDAA